MPIFSLLTVLIRSPRWKPAQRVGFQRGDLINTVNSEKIGKTGDLERMSGQSSRVWRITLIRGGRQRSVTLGG